MLEQIQQPISAELVRYTAIFREALQTSNPLLSAALTHLTRRLGKMMRPTLLLLCAREGGGITTEAMHAAAGLEMLHTASLVHDDVVDESNMRRGQRSVNALFDNKAAVLVGDFITSKALSEIALTHSLDAVSRTAWLGQTLADGELLQLNATQSTVFSEDDYYAVIDKKTASLFATCAYLGTRLAGAPDEKVALLERYGHLAGRCFQMRDDIFDFDESINAGKPKGNDMNEGKLTLPVIFALNTTSNARYHHLAIKVRSLEASKLEVQELADFTVASGGLEYATAEMQRHHDEAVALLAQIDDTAVASALHMYIDYAIRRNI